MIFVNSHVGKTARKAQIACRGYDVPELCVIRRPSHDVEGAGRPGTQCSPWAPCNRRRGGRTTGEPEQHHFPAQWFYGLFRALPGDRAFLPPSPPRSLFPRKTNTSIGASGPHDFASPRHSGARRLPSSRPPHPAANVRDVRNAPLSGETGRIGSSDLPRRVGGIFLRGRIDRLLVICPSGQLVAGVAAGFDLHTRRAARLAPMPLCTRLDPEYD